MIFQFVFNILSLGSKTSGDRKITDNMDIECISKIKDLRTPKEDYPRAVRIEKGLIPVFDAKSICNAETSFFNQLILQELNLNESTFSLPDEELKVLAKLTDNNQETVAESKDFIRAYQEFISEIVNSLSLNGPGVCVVENIFSEEFMTQVMNWVENYFDKNISCKKDHFAFGTNKRIWRLPEKFPPSILYNYLRYQAGSSESSPVFNHIIDSFLGQHHIGSLAINQIMPGGEAQLTHTDYPPGFYTVQDMKKVFTGYGLEKIMPYFSLQAGIALCDMDSLNGSTGVIPYSHLISDSDSLIAGAKPKPGEKENDNTEGKSKNFYEAVQDYIVQTTVKKGSCIFFNRKLLHQGEKNYSEKPRAALLLQAIMPFGVKMEAMETEETWKNLVKFVEEKVKMNGNGKDEDEDDEVKKVREKYFGVSKQLKELLHFRLHGPRFPRDMDAASVEEKNN